MEFEDCGGQQRCGICRPDIRSCLMRCKRLRGIFKNLRGTSSAAYKEMRKILSCAQNDGMMYLE